MVSNYMFDIEYLSVCVFFLMLTYLLYLFGVKSSLY